MQTWQKIQSNAPKESLRVEFNLFALAKNWHIFRFSAPNKVFMVKNQPSSTRLNSNLT